MSETVRLAGYVRVGPQVLREQQLLGKLDKCNFWVREVHFLGHVISAGGVHVDPSKIEAVLSWQNPTNVLEVRSFSG